MVEADPCPLLAAIAEALRLADEAGDHLLAAHLSHALDMAVARGGPLPSRDLH